MYFQTVYYSHFWYSRFAPELEHHLASLRLLSLFFAAVYIPRTHLLTQIVPIQWEIPSAVFASDDVAFLRDLGILRVSVFPGTDGQADNDRITSRAAQTNDVTYANAPTYLHAVAQAPQVIVESTKEALGNTVTFSEYGRWLQVTSPELSKRFLSIADRANIKDVPFFHERFIRELHAELPYPESERIWRETNSIYLTTAVPHHSGLIPYFNDEIESIGFRYEPCGVDRYLFHPESLYTFLAAFLDQRDLHVLLSARAKSALACLKNGGPGHSLLLPFRKAYCALVSDISAVTKPHFAQNAPGQRIVAEWFERALRGSLQNKLALLEGAVEDAGAIGQAIDPSAGIIKAVTRPIVRLGKGTFEWYMRRRRHPALCYFADTLRKTLKELQ